MEAAKRAAKDKEGRRATQRAAPKEKEGGEEAAAAKAGRAGYEAFFSKVPYRAVPGSVHAGVGILIKKGLPARYRGRAEGNRREGGSTLR